MQQKIFNSLSELSKLNKNKLFKNDKLKPIPRKTAVSIARLLSEGFNKDLRKQPSISEYRRAQRVIKDFYNSAMASNTKIVRPRKKNRKLYAEKTGLSPKLKVFPVTLNNEKNKLIIKKVKGKRQVVEKGEFVTYSNYYFNDKKELVKNPEKETNKLLKQMPEKVENLRIIVGQHTTNSVISKELIQKEIEFYMKTYKNAELFVRGLQVASFTGQQIEPKAKRKKRRKNRGRFKV